MKRLAEVTQAVVAHFQSHFGHVVMPRSEQVGRLLKAKLANVLGNGHPHFLGKGATQIERAASHFLPKCLQGGRLREIPLDAIHHAIHAAAGHSHLSVAEKLLIRRRAEEELPHEFDRLGLVPKGLGCREDRRLMQAGDQIPMTGSEGFESAQRGIAAFASESIPHYGMQRPVHSVQMRGEEGGREFDGDEAMDLPGKASSLERLGTLTIKTGGPRRQLELPIAKDQLPGPAEIQAEFEAFRMKTRCPIHLAIRREFVPLETHSQFCEIAEQLTPTRPGRAPQYGFSTIHESGVHAG